MKTRTPKDAVIVAALIGTIFGGAFILAKEAGWLSGRMREAALRENDDMRDHVPMRKKAVLLEAGLDQRDELQACYEGFLKSQPEVDEGVIEVHWLLDKHGKISSMDLVHSELGDETFNRCLLDKIKKMTFKPPPHAKPTLVSHKFNFHKRSPASLDFKQAGGAKESDEE